MVGAFFWQGENMILPGAGYEEKRRAISNEMIIEIRKLPSFNLSMGLEGIAHSPSRIVAVLESV